MLRYLRAALVAVIAIVPPSLASAQNAPQSLISVEELQAQLGQDNLVLLDASPTPFYVAKHIPGAVSVSFTQAQSRSQGVNLSYGGGIDLMTDIDAAFPFQDLPAPQMEKLFQDWGVNKKSQVVIYDQGGAMHATRLFFSFVYHGFPADRVRILNGGLSQWQAKNLPVNQEVAQAAKRGDFKVGALKSEIKTSVPEVLAASGDPDSALVEALSADWHFGEALNYSRRGHIPYAIMIPAADFYNADKTFKSPEEIKRMLDHFGIRPDQTIYTHCGGGIAGSVAFFGIKYLAKHQKVKHFTESQLGWLDDSRELPFWTYDAPYLLRDANWLQWWGGQRTRSLGVTQVSVVDVRSAEQYAEAHTPFALNVPAAEFKKNLKQPAALAKTLGAAGVNPKHEAVVISGEGISKDAALVFVALESLGQKKVSILTDSHDQWAASGFQLRDKPTVVAQKQLPFDLAVPPVEYSAKPRDGILVTDPAYSQGVYPKVYVASGKTLPSVKLAGKVVHVPYTELLTDDGKPKEAAAIWNTLAKAGVPRLAELITVSDDAGEAASNYVVLKLMGFPNVKTLVQ